MLSLCEYKAVYLYEIENRGCVLSRPRAPRVAHRARARETVCAVLCSDAHAHAVLCGVPCTRCRVQDPPPTHTHRPREISIRSARSLCNSTLEQATASIHSLSRVRLQFSEREMQVAPGGHTSNYSPPSPPRRSTHGTVGVRYFAS